jgi:ferredoxin
MKVWIDQDLCTGDGLCVEIAPAVFFMHDDGLAYVKEDAAYFGTTIEYNEDGTPHFKMVKGLARVPDKLLEATIEAAEECPGECIFLEED